MKPNATPSKSSCDSRPTSPNDSTSLPSAAGSRERAPSRGCSTGTRGSKSKALDSHVPLTEEDVAVLLACRDDGEPPVEIHDATIHRRLEAQGLLSRRSGPSPDGDGEAEFWRTTEFGVWALWYLGRVEQMPGKPEGGG